MSDYGHYCGYGLCQELATTTVDYPARVPCQPEERCWGCGIESLDVCDSCAEVAKAEVAARYPGDHLCQRHLDESKITWCVIEDNGGGLHLYVFREVGDHQGCIYAGLHYELMGGANALRRDLAALQSGGDDADAACWDCDPHLDPQASWDEWDHEAQRSGGWHVIADESGPIDEQYMGCAGREVFYPAAAKEA